jgi:hypothetical protein
MTAVETERPVFFGIDAPLPETVLPCRGLILLRGVASLRDRAVQGIRARIGDHELLNATLNDPREDVWRMYPPAQERGQMCGFHHHVELPADLSEGEHTIEFFGELDDGTVTPLGSVRVRVEEPPLYFGLDLPRPGAVLPCRGVFLLRGVLAYRTGPAQGIRAKLDGRELLSAKLNDDRGDVRTNYPPAQAHTKPCGYHFSVQLPDDVAEGEHALELFGEADDGTVSPLGGISVRVEPPPILFGLDLPRPGTVHPLGVPMVLRGLACFADSPAVRLIVRIGSRDVAAGPLNDAREETRDIYPPARSHDLPCGFHLYVHFPEDLEEGEHTLEFFAHKLDGSEYAIGGLVVRFSATEGDVRNPFPEGHFYSAVVNVRELAQERDRVWPQEPIILGIDFRADAQQEFLAEEFPKYLGDYDYPFNAPAGAPEWVFRHNNAVFGEFDAKTLYVILRSLRPANMIEIGSGFSSLLVADVNRRFLNGELKFTCIEPYPRQFLKNGIPGLSRVIVERVQHVDYRVYDALGPGDILFIDSSHVGKTGSDVNHEFFEVIPRLRSGVVIHVHDIFFPHDYPLERVLGEKLSWNEQYLLRAMLMFSNAFEVMFGTSYVEHYFPELCKKAARVDPRGWSGSFWFRKVR